MPAPIPLPADTWTQAIIPGYIEADLMATNDDLMIEQAAAVPLFADAGDILYRNDRLPRQFLSNDPSQAIWVRPRQPGVASVLRVTKLVGGTSLYSNPNSGSPMGLLLALTTTLPGLTSPLAGQTYVVNQAPTVTASAYSAGNVLGGLLTFANVVRAGPLSGTLVSIKARWKSVQTTTLKVTLFNANPSSSTWTDKSAAAINAADVFKIIGVYTLPAPDSTMGTASVHTLDNIQDALALTTTSLYAVVTVVATPTPASTSDFSIDIVVRPD